MESEKSGIIEVYGLGYVGFPLAVRLATANYDVVGIDVNTDRIQRLKKKELRDSEKYLEKEFLECRQKNKFNLKLVNFNTSKPKIGIICVPTPIPDQNTSSDIFVKRAVQTFLENAKSRSFKIPKFFLISHDLML